MAGWMDGWMEEWIELSIDAWIAGCPHGWFAAVLEGCLR